VKQIKDSLHLIKIHLNKVGYVIGLNNNYRRIILSGYRELDP